MEVILMHLPNHKDARRREDKSYKRVEFNFDNKIKDKGRGCPST